MYLAYIMHNGHCTVILETFTEDNYIVEKLTIKCFQTESLRNTLNNHCHVHTHSHTHRSSLEKESAIHIRRQEKVTHICACKHIQVRGWWIMSHGCILYYPFVIVRHAEVSQSI